MNVEVVAPDDLAERAAALLAGLVSDAVAARGTATLAVSGGSTPAATFAALARRPVPWERVHLFQVDERIAPDGDPARNLTGLNRDLLERLPVAPAGLHPMPAADALPSASAAEHAAARYASVLAELSGSPPVLDVVHLGLGDDGHTASLVPDDPVLDVVDRDVATTRPYQGHRRLTLTYPALARARHLVWLVAGESKAPALRRLRAGDHAIPAARVPQDRVTVLADRLAATS